MGRRARKVLTAATATTITATRYTNPSPEKPTIARMGPAIAPPAAPHKFMTRSEVPCSPGRSCTGTDSVTMVDPATVEVLPYPKAIPFAHDLRT